jgi:hypothetical protein
MNGAFYLLRINLPKSVAVEDLPAVSENRVNLSPDSFHKFFGQSNLSAFKRKNGVCVAIEQ